MTLTDELLHMLNQLDDAQKQRLLNFARVLAKTAPLRGESGKSIVQATGFFDAKSLDEMETAIDETDNLNSQI